MTLQQQAAAAAAGGDPRLVGNWVHQNLVTSGAGYINTNNYQFANGKPLVDYVILKI